MKVGFGGVLDQVTGRENAVRGIILEIRLAPLKPLLALRDVKLHWPKWILNCV